MSRERITAGPGFNRRLIPQASPMIQDYFSGITPAAAAGFVGLLSLANMAGRSSMVLVIVLWAMVLIPLAWGVYETLKGVVALFTGG